MPNMTCKLVVKADDWENEAHSIVLDSGVLATLVEALPHNTCEDVVSLLGYLAQSPSSEVRQNVADRREINEDTVELLAKDEAVDVRRSIVSNDKFQAWATTEIVIDHIRSDTECAKSIVEYLDDFTAVDKNAIAGVLHNHSDPEVRLALAGNWRTPKKILKQLLTDPERSVRHAARDTLDSLD